MILFITKKATAIYKVNKILLIFLAVFFSCGINAQELYSYCFADSVNLSEVQHSLGIILLPKDIVATRKGNCLDIITSPDREKLFEKYLSRRYDLKREKQTELSAEAVNNCHLNLKTTKNSSTDSQDFKLGQKNVAKSTESTSKSVSLMEMMIGAGIPSEFEAGTESLKVTCHPIGESSASLIFSYADKNAARVSTQVMIKKGEWLNIASVKKELNDKIRALGIPQSDLGQASGLNETVYELQFK